LGFQFIVFAKAEASDLKFGMQLGFAKAGLPRSSNKAVNDRDVSKS